MKLNRYGLRSLIENILNEEEFDDSDPKKFKKSGQSFKVEPEEVLPRPAKDNKRALKFADSNAARKKYNIPGSGDYYVYQAPNKERKIGNVRYSDGDPYTYEDVGNGYYRVMSGPYNSGKRDNGKIIGTTPIGAKFKPKPPPDEPVIDDDDIFEVDLSNLDFTFNGETYENNNIVKKANQDIAISINNDIKKKDPQPTIQAIENFLNANQGRPGQKHSNVGLKTLESDPYVFFGPQNDDRQENLKKLKNIYNMIGDALNNRGFTNAPKNINLIKFSHGKTNESMSRGSLLRRRYRRY